MDKLNLWFTENLEILPGHRAQIQVKKTLHYEKSDFQEIAFFETTRFGRMLVLDGIIQTTEYDEFGYHEMMAHVPLFSHVNPEKVLIIGGGDGGLAREVLKHPTVKEVHMCEIDRRVVDLSREYLPHHASALDDPRLQLIYDDGVKWAKEHNNEYDVMLVDSTDPVGPAEGLFQFPFYETCKDALKEDGILVTQGENMLMLGEIVKRLMDFGKKLFPVSGYYYTLVPSYPTGLLGYTYFSKKYANTDNYLDKIKKDEYKSFMDQLNFWTPELQTSMFSLPASVKRNLGV